MHATGWRGSGLEGRGRSRQVGVHRAFYETTFILPLLAWWVHKVGGRRSEVGG